MIMKPYQEEPDLHWIRGALQSAVAIEHAAMPLYAAAMYSLEVQNYPAYNTLRSVLMEEMLHMAAAGNALAALGGQPRIKSLDPTMIVDKIPGPIRDIRGRFAKLSRRQLDTFMRLEAPEELVAATDRNGRDAPGYGSIGAFYRAIAVAVERNADAVVAAVRSEQRSNQVGGNLGYAVISPDGDPVKQLLSSIDLIIDQGEGNGRTTLSAGQPSGDELSHYARFAELRFGRAYSGPGPDDTAGATPEGQRRHFRGAPITWPTVINFLTVPRDGYRAILRLDPNRAEVEQALRKFDQAYTRMLLALDDCWNGPAADSWPALGRAVFEMNELRVSSCFEILRQEVPPAVIARLPDLYPAEYDELAQLTDLDAPVFYGPRFINTSIA